MSEPQRQLKFHSVLLAGEESNLLHEDGSSNVFTYPGKQPPGAKASQQRNITDLPLFKCSRKVEPSETKSLSCFKRCSRSVFPLDVLSAHDLNSALNFGDFSAAQI